MTAETTDSLGESPWISSEALFVAGVRAAFEQARFDAEGISGHFELDESIVIEESEFGRLRRLTAGGSPLETWMRLFLFDMDVDVAAAERAAHPLGLKDWISGGLLALRDDDGATRVCSALRFVPYEGLILAWDHRPIAGVREPRTDDIPGMGRASTGLGHATIKRPATRALDLGTGCGGQAIAMTRWAGEVVATDLSPRAIGLARFNAAMNGVTGIEFREGNFLEPVLGESFDLITMNPPFIIAPDSRFTYRDSGMPVDTFCRGIARQAPALLADGGFVQFSAQWAHVGDQRWQDRLAEWFSDTECDAWVLELQRQSAAKAASQWIEETEHLEGDAFTRRWEQWMNFYDSEQIGAISTGIITMRKRPGAHNWHRFDDDIDGVTAEAGAFIERGFRVADVLDSLASDRALLDLPLRVSKHVRLEQSGRSEGTGWHSDHLELRYTGGVQSSARADSLIVELVGGANGERPLRTLVEELTRRIGADFEPAATSITPLVRTFVRRGFLLPPDFED